MNNFSIFQIGTSGTEPIEIGTTSEPIARPRLVAVDGEIRDAGAIPTGRNAEKSVQDRWKRFFAGNKEDKDAFFPANTRAAKRAQKQADRTRRRKHQRGYFRRELAKENAARDLLNLINIVDGKVPASPMMRHRATGALASRVAYLHNEQQKVYDKALEARQKDRDLPAPTPPTRHDEIERQLRELAKTAVLPTPRGARPSKAEEIRDLTRTLDSRSQAVTVGRTGRAG